MTVATRPTGSTGSRANPNSAGNPATRVAAQASTIVALSRSPSRTAHLPGPKRRLAPSSPWQTAAKNTKEPVSGRATNASGSTHRRSNSEANASAAAWRVVSTAFRPAFVRAPILRPPRSWPSSSCPRAPSCGSGRRTCPGSHRSGPRCARRPPHALGRCPSNLRPKERVYHRCARSP
jgi:hypothetical protein